MRTYATCAALIAAVLSAAPTFAQPTPDRAATSLPPASSEIITIKVGTSSMAGSVETPAGNGQHGAVVIIAPNDPHSADVAKALAKSLAQHGLVALTYDASEVNADNAHAALDVLRLRGDVHKEFVGVIGIGTGTSVVQKIGSDDDIHYAVAIRSSKDGSLKDANPSAYKLDKKVLLVQAMDEPFGSEADRQCQSAQKKAANLTVWATSTEDVDGLSGNTALLDRIGTWTAERAN